MASTRRPSPASRRRSARWWPWGCRSRWSSAAAISSAGIAASAGGMERATGDYMGMLATVINALALQDCHREGGGAHPGAVRHRDARGGRALYPPPRHPPPGEGAGGGLRRRHRQPLLHHRHRRRPARGGDRRRGHPQGDQGGRDLHRRPRQGLRGDQAAADQLHRGAQPWAPGDGHHRHLALHGEQAADRRLRPDASWATSGGSSWASRWARWCPPTPDPAKG